MTFKVKRFKYRNKSTGEYSRLFPTEKAAIVAAMKESYRMCFRAGSWAEYFEIVEELV